MPTRLFLRQGDLTIAVVATADDLRWIGEFFGDIYASAGAADAIEVGMSSEGRPVALETPVGERLAFALDAGPVRLPAFGLRLPSGAVGERLLEAEAAIAYDVSTDPPRTTVRYWGNRLTARVRLMRVIREYFHNASIRAGGVVLHAAAVVHAGRAVVIAGPKGAGKTTTMLRLLGGGDTSFLSNDRVLIAGARTPQVASIPTVVSVRDGSLELLPDLAARLSAVGDFRHHDAERRAAGRQPPVRTPTGIRLGAQQLCAAAGWRITPAAPLGAVVVIDDGLPAGTLRRLDADEAARALDGARLGSRADVCASEVFLPPSHLPHGLRPPHPIRCVSTGRLGSSPDSVERLLSICALACA